jgi:hypothetical protein
VVKEEEEGEKVEVEIKKEEVEIKKEEVVKPVVKQESAKETQTGEDAKIVQTPADTKTTPADTKVTPVVAAEHLEDDSDDEFERWPKCLIEVDTKWTYNGEGLPKVDKVYVKEGEKQNLEKVNFLLY